MITGCQEAPDAVFFHMVVEGYYPWRDGRKIPNLHCQQTKETTDERTGPRVLII